MFNEIIKERVYEFFSPKYHMPPNLVLSNKWLIHVTGNRQINAKFTNSDRRP